MISFPLRPLMCGLVLCLTAPVHAQSAGADAVAAVTAAAAGNYAQARDLASDDKVMADLVRWMRLQRGGEPFADYVAFLQARPDWPDQERLRARAEERIGTRRDPAEVVAWFGDAAPQTGEGAVALATALLQSGEIDRAKEVIAAAWVDLRLTESGHDAMLEAFPDLLEPLHAARVDALLWRWRTVEAGWMLPLLDDDQMALAEARIALIRKRGDVDAKLDAVPAALRNTPGLLYDRYNWLADKGRRSEAVTLIKAQSTDADALGEPFRWSGWRRSLARWLMREGDIDSAYELATQHYLTEGSAYADLEWLAGYLSLTYRGDAAAALAHFDAARAAVDSPISVGRLEYWRGRALEAQDDPGARAAYSLAAAHQTSFYGLLASEKVNRPLDPALTGRDDPSDWQAAGLLEQDQIRAAIALIDAGERGLAVRFFRHLGLTLGADDLARLGALLREKDEAYFAVLLGKTAVTRDVLVPSIYFPLHDLIEMDLDAPPALSLSIARRESEFNAGVGSPVGALGLMQLMPATAEEVAGFLDLPYNRNRLTADWRYNARLGAHYLSVLEEQFGPSPVQIAAGYNAGPSRPEIWMDERGDPRLGEVDVVDWIEHIPFRETRNYVMRVTESIPVYEARLTGKTGPVRFTALLLGNKPLVRPQLRPSAQGRVSTADLPPRRVVARPTPPSGPSTVRPLSRPGG